MKKEKDTIKNAASYSSGNALELFSQCAEIQLTLCAIFFDVTFISHFVTSTLHLHKAQNVRACQICCLEKKMFLLCPDKNILALRL